MQGPRIRNRWRWAHEAPRFLWVFSATRGPNVAQKSFPTPVSGTIPTLNSIQWLHDTGNVLQADSSLHTIVDRLEGGDGTTPGN